MTVLASKTQQSRDTGVKYTRDMKNSIGIYAKPGAIIISISSLRLHGASGARRKEPSGRCCAESAKIAFCKEQQIELGKPAPFLYARQGDERVLIKTQNSFLC